MQDNNTTTVSFINMHHSRKIPYCILDFEESNKAKGHVIIFNMKL